MEREALKETSRMVVKFGTGILTSRSKQIDPGQIEQLVAQVAAQRQAGREIIVVSSGAVGAGMGVLAMDKRPTDLSDLQACAAVGQSQLMSTYTKLFARHNMQVAQVLLTHDDLEHQERHLNARNTLVSLLDKGVVPIVNENDAVSYTELKFGDNDWLAALVACLLPADLLILLTTGDGLVENFGKKKSTHDPGCRDDRCEYPKTRRWHIERKRRRWHGCQAARRQDDCPHRHPDGHRLRQEEARPRQHHRRSR